MDAGCVYDGGMPLIEIVRIVGVALGLWGAILTVPGAATRVGRDFKFLGQKVWAWIRRRRPTTVHAGVAVGLSGMGGLAVGSERRLPSPLPGDVSAQIRLLTEFVNGLAGTIGALDRDLTMKIVELQQTQVAAQVAHTALAAKLDAERQLAEKSSLTINARGLPLIGLSILLSGLPDTWVGNPWVLGVLLAVSGLLIVITLVRLRRPDLLDS